MEQICSELTGSSHLVFGYGKERTWLSIYEKQMEKFVSIIFCFVCVIPQIFPSVFSIAF